jgi:hypothetical protein
LPSRVLLECNRAPQVGPAPWPQRWAPDENMASLRLKIPRQGKSRSPARSGNSCQAAVGMQIMDNGSAHRHNYQEKRSLTAVPLGPAPWPQRWAPDENMASLRLKIPRQGKSRSPCVPRLWIVRRIRRERSFAFQGVARVHMGNVISPAGVIHYLHAHCSLTRIARPGRPSSAGRPSSLAATMGLWIVRRIRRERSFAFQGVARVHMGNVISPAGVS